MSADLPDRRLWRRLALTGHPRDITRCACCWNTMDAEDPKLAESDNEAGVCRGCCGEVYDED